MTDVDAALERLLEEARGDDQVVAVLQHGSSLHSATPRDLDVCVVLRSRPRPRETRWLRYQGFSTPQRHAGLDVSIFQELPLYIRREVLADHEPLYVSDEEALYDIAIQTVKAWGDFEPIYRGYLEAVARG